MTSAVRIGYVFPNIREDRIAQTFNELDLGEIQKIDFTPRSDHEGTPYNLVHVHIKWNTNDHTKDFLNALDRGEVVNIVYDDPWYWKVTKPRARPQQQVNKFKSRPAPRIEFTSNTPKDKTETEKN